MFDKQQRTNQYRFAAAMLNELLWNRWGAHFPRIELRRFKNIDFFPAKPPRFEEIETICIGSKTRTIGDALVLSTLPAKIKALYPHVKIYTYPRGFNPVVFTGNPHVIGAQWLPDTVYGDDCNSGMGHLIQLKERFFGLPVSESAAPELYLRHSEERWIEDQLHQVSTDQTRELPLCIIHPWGKTHSSVLSGETWESMVRKNRDRLRFWQVGIEGHVRIPGCEHHLLLPRAFAHARKLFATLSRADLFIGVDSGPMHVARAFHVPSLVFTDYGTSAENIFSNRWKILHQDHQQSWNHYFIYEGNQHLDVPGTSSDTLLKGMQSFIDERLESLICLDS